MCRRTIIVLIHLATTNLYAEKRNIHPNWAPKTWILRSDDITTIMETVVAIQSFFDVFSILRPIQYRNVNLYWRLSRCLDQVNM